MNMNELNEAVREAAVALAQATTNHMEAAEALHLASLQVVDVAYTNGTINGKNKEQRDHQLEHLVAFDADCMDAREAMFAARNNQQHAQLAYEFELRRYEIGLRETA